MSPGSVIAVNPAGEMCEVALAQRTSACGAVAATQGATGLPVFDMTTMIEWIQRSVVRRPYDGWV